MFHLQIAHLRDLLQQHLIRQYGNEIAPQGRLLPAVADALSSLGTRYEIDVTVTASISESVKKEHPLKLSITAQPQASALSRQTHSQISIWGVMAEHGADADRTLQPLFIEIITPGEESFDKKLRSTLALLLHPGHSLASLAPQVSNELPMAA